MISQTVKEYLKDLLSKQLNTTVGSLDIISVGGGSINDTYRITLNHHLKFFLKLNSASKFPGLFEKERTGLEYLEKQNCIRTPPIISYSVVDNYQLLLMEWINAGISNEYFWKKFGEQLAHLHLKSNEAFGFAENNYMGSLPQENKFVKTWIDFFIHQRLHPQLRLAERQNLLLPQHVSGFESLYTKLQSIFNTEPPALLHGDLWSGNFMCNDESLPVLIDPAVYYGHRSMDLGMTTLFSGFDSSFYDAYHYHYPFPPNYREQWEICNLYPLLIHLNLFGSGYLNNIVAILRKYA